MSLLKGKHENVCITGKILFKTGHQIWTVKSTGVFLYIHITTCKWM